MTHAPFLPSVSHLPLPVLGAPSEQREVPHFVIVTVTTLRAKAAHEKTTHTCSSSGICIFGVVSVCVGAEQVGGEHVHTCLVLSLTRTGSASADDGWDNS